jgi:hypothetical protein
LGILQAEARKRSILPNAKAFHCEYYDDCQRSRTIRGIPPLRRWKSSQMSYVGREYGRPIAGKNFRLVVIGMSHAGSGGKDFFERRRTAEEDLQESVNPHYRGVLWMASAILGQSGRYCFDKCRNELRCRHEDLPKGNRCALSSIAQPNLAKCAGGKEGKCRTTHEMYNNCSGNLFAELEVLRPTMIVFQTAAGRSVFPAKVEQMGDWTLAPLAGSPRYESGIAVAQRLVTPRLRSYVLFLDNLAPEPTSISSGNRPLNLR